MKIIRAQHLGMCFGVRDAIDLALSQAKHGPLTIMGELVHNSTVLGQLRDKGIRMANEAAEVDTHVAMVTAHGASQKAIGAARELGLNVLEATCPLVHFAHRSVLSLAQQGYYPIIIGKANHVEVKGLTGDLVEFTVVGNEEELNDIPHRPRLGVMAQTTQPIERVRQMVENLRRARPGVEIRFIDTVCQPTKQRQSAAIELAKSADVVIVVGGAHSNNTKELAATCGRFCDRVYQVQSPDDLNPNWFWDAEIVGLTAGTSTPDETIAAVENRLKAVALRQVSEAHA
jgi:4-hydroxy-3-methylbut-2-enyl diphosphate reductase